MYKIKFKWQTKKISLTGFIYRLEFQNSHAKSNPLYSPPIVEEEYKVNERSRSAEVEVEKQGEYLISLRSQDHLGFSDESTAYVECHPRPRCRNQPPVDPCLRIKQFRYKIPQLTNVSASFLRLQTESEVIVLEWDVKGWV